MTRPSKTCCKPGCPASPTKLIVLRDGPYTAACDIHASAVTSSIPFDVPYAVTPIGQPDREEPT